MAPLSGYSITCLKTNAAASAGGGGIVGAIAVIRGISILFGGAGNCGLDGRRSDGIVGPALAGRDGFAGATGTGSTRSPGICGRRSGVRYVCDSTPGSVPATFALVTVHDASADRERAYCANARSESTSKKHSWSG